MNTKTFIIGGSALCGKTFMQKKRIEYLQKQGKKVFVIGEEEDSE